MQIKRQNISSVLIFHLQVEQNPQDGSVKPMQSDVRIDVWSAPKRCHVEKIPYTDRYVSQP